LRTIILFVVMLFFITAVAQNLQAQACCTAGTPLMSSLDVTATPAGTWRVALAYHYNLLDDVVAGSQSIEGFRQRLSQSMLADISYGLNHRFSFTALLSFIRQTRSLKQPNSAQSLEKIATLGVGDMLFLVKYNLIPLEIFSQTQLSAGFGLKMPTGESTLRNGQILLPADMQPGTGSWDAILWAYYFRGFLPFSKWNYFANFTYRLNGTNHRYQLSDVNSGYSFGNESLLSIGTSLSTDSLLAFSLIVRYRSTRPDRLGDSTVPNTGGHWVNLRPGINVNFETVSLRFSGSVPVYRQLTGTQLTTSYTLSFGLFYSRPFTH